MTNPGILSGGPIEHLEKGWALMPFVGKKVHYWIEDKKTMPAQIRDGGRVRYYTSRCGVMVHMRKCVIQSVLAEKGVLGLSKRDLNDIVDKLS